MLKIIAAGVVGALALNAAGALAGDRDALEPSAPRPIAELSGSRTATVAGTVVGLTRGHFILADADDRTVRVDAHHVRLPDLGTGQLITVTGRVDEGELKARHVIREDGSVVAPQGRGEEARRGSGQAQSDRSWDDDDGHGHNGESHGDDGRGVDGGRGER